MRDADRFPSTNTTVGLGRSFSWNQWARVNGVVDKAFRVRRGETDRARFLARAAELRQSRNANRGIGNRTNNHQDPAGLCLCSGVPT